MAIENSATKYPVRSVTSYISLSDSTLPIARAGRGWELSTLLMLTAHKNL